MKKTCTLGDYTVTYEGTPEEISEYERLVSAEEKPKITWEQPPVIPSDYRYDWPPDVQITSGGITVADAEVGIRVLGKALNNHGLTT